MDNKTLDEWLEDLGVEKTPDPVPNKKLKGSSNIVNFIEDFGVKAGIDKVPNYVIFYTYRKIWEGVHRNHKKNKITFFKTFNKHFTATRTGKQRYYLLDGGVFDLSRKGLLEAKHYDEKYQKRQKNKNEKEKNKKAKSQISKSKKES